MITNMFDYQSSIDAFATLGDLATAIRYKWANVASAQSSLSTKDAAAFVRPDMFLRPIAKPEQVIKEAQTRGHKIVFAHFQSDFKGGKIPFWHVSDPLSPSYQSTLSMEGLRQWKVL